jgi:hypothetical protein
VKKKLETGSLRPGMAMAMVGGEEGGGGMAFGKFFCLDDGVVFL